MARTELFARAQAGGVFTIAGVDKHPGEIYFVNSVTGTDAAGYGHNPDAPFATIAYAFSSDVLVAGDVVYVMPGHTESVVGAAGIAQDIAGISVIGLGEGSSRPRVTFSTATAASWLISAANSKVENIVGIGNKDGLTQPFDVTASDVELDIEWRDTSSTVEAAAVVLATTVSRLKVNLKYLGFTAGNAAVNPIHLAGVTGARINIDGYGVVSAAWVEFTDVLCTDVVVTGRTYTQGVTNGSRNVVDTATNSKWYAVIDDMSAGAKFSGGSAAAMASDDVSSVYSRIGAPVAASISADVAAVDAKVTTLIADTVNGFVVTKAAAALPQSTAAAIFTVTGTVLLKRIIGVITVGIGAFANATKLKGNSTGAGATTDLCATLELNNAAAANRLEIAGTLANAMQKSLDLPGPAVQVTELVIPPGTIDLDCAGSDGGAGRIRWSVVYLPLEAGASIVAA